MEQQSHKDLSWVHKIQLEVVESEDDSLVISCTWDEKDADLQLWNEWGEEKQTEFVLAALQNSVKKLDLLDPDPSEE